MSALLLAIAPALVKFILGALSGGLVMLEAYFAGVSKEKSQSVTQTLKDTLAKSITRSSIDQQVAQDAAPTTFDKDSIVNVGPTSIATGSITAPQMQSPSSASPPSDVASPTISIARTDIDGADKLRNIWDRD